MTVAVLLLCLLTALLGGAVGWLLASTRVTPTGAEARLTAASAQALESTSRQLVTLAEQSLGRVAGEARADLALSQQSVAGLVAPVAESLAAVDRQLREVEAQRAGAFAGLREQVQEVQRSSEALRGETAALVTALRAPATRGRWGELQLRRVLEAAGALEHCDFTAQTSVRDGTGALLRPDVVIRLAGGGTVVVDSKVPLAAHLEALEATDEATRADRRRAHARQLREHVRALSDKAYWAQFAQAPEFVVLFVPGDAFLDAALQADPALQEAAFATNVVLATPSTLVAIVRTVAHAWRQDAIATSAREVGELGRQLYERLGSLGAHVDKLGRSLTTAVRSYNDAVGSLEGRVLVTARRLHGLDVVGTELPTPAQVETLTRVVSAPELTGDGGRLRPVPDQAAG